MRRRLPAATLASVVLALVVVDARGAAADVTSREAKAVGITTVEVPGDAGVLVVRGPRTARPIVYLHGMCSDPREDLAAWGGLATRHGPILALLGDVPCPDKPGRTKWSSEPEALDGRVRAAVHAAFGRPGRDEVVVIGESMGAARAELLATRYPERYARAVLVGSPQAPSPQSFRAARAIATLAGEREDASKMRAGAEALAAAGVRARFFALPGASHGNYGPDGARVMAEAVAFVTSP